MYNVTIIIPTHNRHNYLNRSILYYKEINCHVIYCDSSLNEFSGVLGENITYKHYPGEKFHSKILMSLELVKTRFVVLCPDDDFILIDSIYSASIFLESNRNYKTMVGRFIAFKEQFDGRFYERYGKLPNDINFHPKKNAKHFFENYYQILWAMFDIDILKTSFNIISTAKFENDNFIEIVLGGVACFNGGIKFTNTLWGVRELNIADHWGANHKAITKAKDIKTEKDLINFQTYIDSSTSVGFSKLILKSYFPSIKKKIGLYLNKFKPMKLLRIFKFNTSRDLTLGESKITEFEKQQLKKIVAILELN